MLVQMRGLQMGKFDFVNQNIEVSDQLSDAEPPSKVRNENTKNYRNVTVSIILLLTLCIGIFFVAISPKITKTTAPTLNETGLKTGPKDAVQVGIKGGYEPVYIESGSAAYYKLEFKMYKTNEFNAGAEIQIKNDSADNWKELVFYFIPNTFNNPDTARCFNRNTGYTNEPCMEELSGGKAAIQNVNINGVPVEYILDEDTLKIPLAKQLAPEETLSIGVSYTFSLPGFSREGNNYYLAQWYPMLATYHDGWIKQPYFSETETHLTTHSNFEVKYDIPSEYHLLSSAEADTQESSENGVITGTKIKEMFIGITKDPDIKETNIKNIQVRIFSEQANPELQEKALKTASDAISFFEEKIGTYPYTQLDIIISDGASKEYPGIVKVSKTEDTTTTFEHSLVHEIAHQWFYGVINSDRHLDGWLDEGLTEFSTSLFFFSHQKKNEQESFAFAENYYKVIKELEPKVSNLVISEYSNRSGSLTAYLNAQPTIKLWKLIKPYGGDDTALRFLSDFYKTYSYQQVTTEEFARFTKKYFDTDYSLFSKWLFFIPFSDIDVVNVKL
jgi:hypothetical protein